MPVELFLYSSFDRSVKRLDPAQKNIIAQILEAVVVYFGTKADLHAAQARAPRFFFKKLREPYYEAGVESRLRIIFEKQEGNFYAVLAGSHDQIKRFLSL